ncbi:MAG TPA: hypothetical protein VFW83_11210, partial [Bryobacteraceae bacterium]|nr:hypothetical protein [Bryobacteraceae bacterium]
MRKPVLRNSLLLAIGAASAAMLLVSRDGRAQSSGGQQTLGPQDVILRAMRDEIQRSRQLSVVDGQDPPYFFSYDLTDAEDLRVSASMGSAITV